MHRELSKQAFTFVAAVNSRGVLENNLLASPCFRKPYLHQIIIQEGFSSAGQAYNDAIAKSRNDIIIFIHQDMFLPEQWIGEFEAALEYLEANDPTWGVLGCYGKTLNHGGRGYVYQSGVGAIGEPFDRPAPIQTLDEIVLILRKSSGLKFDESLPHFHLYGTDICLRAQQAGRANYAIPAFCFHNTNQGFVLPKEFYQCYAHVKRAWKAHLPIQASCIRITRFNLAVYKRKLYEIYYRYSRKEAAKGLRVPDVKQLIEEADVKVQPRETSGCAV